MKGVASGISSLDRIGIAKLTLAFLSITYCLASGQTGEQTKEIIPQASSSADRPLPNSRLGPGDELSIKVAETEELNGIKVRLDPSGFLHLPLVGRIEAAGMTVEQLEAEISTRLRVYVKKPDVSVSIVEYHSQPVSVLGCVTNPGVHQVQGYKTLAEVLALAGGLRPDAGYSIRITRRAEWGAIPLPNAEWDPPRQFSIGEVSTTSLIGATNPAENIQILPEDIITVPKAEMVYVQGQVRHPGGYILHDKVSMSVLAALSLAEGLDKTAAPRTARILRVVSGNTHREEMIVDLKRILDGKAPDCMMQAEDILFVPSSVSKSVTIKAIETMLAIGTGVAVYGRY